MAALICVLASDKVAIEALLKVMDSIVSEIRKNRIGICFMVFYSYDIKNVFRYRDIFTRYVDIGIRVYIENEHSQLIKILAPCTTIYVDSEDYVAKELSKKINVTVKMV